MVHGFDVVSVAATSVTGTTVINTGWSDDVLSIIGGTFTGATTINTDIGNDIVGIVGIGPARAKFVGKLTLTTGDDADIVGLSVLEQAPTTTSAIAPSAARVAVSMSQSSVRVSTPGVGVRDIAATLAVRQEPDDATDSSNRPVSRGTCSRGAD